MGVTLLHATAIVVPVMAGIISNFVGYQIPVFIACVSALVARRLDPQGLRSAARGAEQAATAGAGG
jgi:hypothetical protein